jgi:post-segregation antitoxin (ccd killing protein)
MAERARSKVHVEYEIFKWLLANVNLSDLRESMIPDEMDDVADKRWEAGAKSAFQFVNNLVERRLHRLPKTHPDYKEAK